MKPKRKEDLGLMEAVRGLICLACASLDPRGAHAAMMEGNFVRSHPHHVKTKKSGGPDEPWNLMPVCPNHHQEIHRVGIAVMADQYGVIRDWLDAGGWIYDDFQGWTHPQ